MKKTFILLGALLCMSVAVAQDVQKIKVACIGNSITFGSGIKDRGRDSYPSILNRLLGTDKYEVRNYGVSARTLLSKGDHPYINEQAYRDALAFNPDIVTIKLGTNDTKPHNWKHGAEFKEDLRALVASFQQLESKPTVYVCYPVYAERLSWGINDSVAYNYIIPTIQEVAKEMNLPIIDLYTPYKPYHHLSHDGVHPKEDGAAIIAHEIACAIKETDKKVIKRRQKAAYKLAKEAKKK